MARVLGLLASGRTKGFTARLLEAATMGAESVAGVEIEYVHLHKYQIRPCASCFSCIRRQEHTCAQHDDMGAKGALMEKVKTANGWILADAVHFWGPSAQAHLFVERCYPFLWSGDLNGMPFASISCASNQGMQRLATTEICKWAFAFGMRYVGGLPVHTTHLEWAVGQAKDLGRLLGEAALRDEEGRIEYPEPDRYVDSLDHPFSVLEPYLDNLTNGTMAYEDSLIAQGLESFNNEEALDLLRQAREPFEGALAHFAGGDRQAACADLVRASALWTHATWQEFLASDVIKSEVPGAYRPLADA
ncbi:MAG: flavodoxin family protein [Gemmatimonadetes bacterium]|jgi:multimeric flavodoxin WrbA|nr:flavodoxin family protein [Gemmatimonadota bacterium]MBT7864179.1 flavodoxin family protein [Gemmatimonadota bacterium]